MKNLVALTFVVLALMPEGSLARTRNTGNQTIFQQPDDVKNAPDAIRQSCHRFWDTAHDRGTPEFVACVRSKMKR